MPKVYHIFIGEKKTLYNNRPGATNSKAGELHIHTHTHLPKAYSRVTGSLPPGLAIFQRMNSSLIRTRSCEAVHCCQACIAKDSSISMLFPE